MPCEAVVQRHDTPSFFVAGTRDNPGSVLECAGARNDSPNRVPTRYARNRECRRSRSEGLPGSCAISPVGGPILGRAGQRAGGHVDERPFGMSRRFRFLSTQGPMASHPLIRGHCACGNRSITPLKDRSSIKVGGRDITAACEKLAQQYVAARDYLGMRRSSRLERPRAR